MSTLSNNERIRQVANALKDLNANVAYVGGAVIQLYSSDRAATNPATTYDVDCVVDVTTYKEYRDFEKKLYEKHFINDTSEGAPICRYLNFGEKVDFMPKVDTEIGKSNSWYLNGMKYRIEYHLDQKTTIFIMPVAYFLASKLEALHSRGGEDYRGEKDFEDIVFVLNSCTNLKDKVNSSPDTEVKEYLKQEFKALIDRKNLREEIESALLEEGRLDFVIGAIKSIA